MEATKSTVPYTVFVPFWDHPYRRLLLPFYSVLPAVKSKKSNVKHSYRNWCLEINKIVPTADDIVKKSSYRTGSNPETWWCPWQIYSVWLSQMQREIKQTILAVHIMILTSMIVIMKLTQNCKSRQKKKKSECYADILSNSSPRHRNDWRINAVTRGCQSPLSLVKIQKLQNIK